MCINKTIVISFVIIIIIVAIIIVINKVQYII